jgi:glutaryl-CoA dehydrogenase
LPDIAMATTTTKTSTKTPFHWNDPFLLDRQLTDDERMVRETARDYCRDKLAPRVLDMFRNETVDTSIFREFGALDMLGIVIPEQ